MTEKFKNFFSSIFDLKNKKDVNVLKNEQCLSKSKFKKRLIVIILVFLSVALFFYLGFVLFGLYREGVSFYRNIDSFFDSVKTQDINKAKQKLSDSKGDLSKIYSNYQKIIWFKYLPFLGKYFEDAGYAINVLKHGIDGLEVVILDIDATSNVLDVQKSANGDIYTQRLDLLVGIFTRVIANYDLLIERINLIDAEIANINPQDYPEKIGGFYLRQSMDDYILSFKAVRHFFINSKALLGEVPYFLGLESARQYMIVFQNDKELRPTGGFITAYTLAKVEKGNFEPILSSDIYDLDDKYSPTIQAPDPIINHIKGPYVLFPNLRLRDMNWSPDFAVSMELFAKEAQKAGVKNIDGIISVDTEALLRLVEAIGAIEVPGYGEYSSEIISVCKCPQVIYELESFASIEGPIVWSENESGKVVFAPENYDDRKKIIGPLMNALINSVFNLPVEKMPLLVKAFIDSFSQKHIMLYMFDEKAQSAIEIANLGGRINDFDGDYLHINDSNLGGRKSNLYVTQEVSQKINILKGNEIEKIVTITYKNPEKYDGWLNSVLPNWLRVYVPKGSQLISAEGFWEKVEPYDELGKTVFAGYFELRPQGIAKITLKYKLPFVLKDNLYSLRMQKQPGKKPFLYSVDFGYTKKEFFLSTDKDIVHKMQ